MTKLLWLCTIAIGVRMLYEMTFDFRHSGERVRRLLYIVALGWCIALAFVAIWWLREF